MLLPLNDSSHIQWAPSISEAEWIASRVGNLGEGVTSVIPTGFESYSRILHPAWSEDGGQPQGSPIRWHTIAEWSGIGLTRLAQFHSVALGPREVRGDPPFDRGPDEGSMSLRDLEALASTLRRWTATPEECFFCIWEGWGCLRVPPEVDRGPRVRLPARDYLLYQGPIETALLNVAEKPWRQTPNLWWPRDRSWFVGSEIDLTCSYVGGPKRLIDELLATRTLEALPAHPDDPLLIVEPWLQERVAEALDDLFATGSTLVSVPPFGWVRAEIERAPDGRWMQPTWASERAVRGRRRRTTPQSMGRLDEYEDARRAAESGLTQLLIDLAD